MVTRLRQHDAEIRTINFYFFIFTSKHVWKTRALVPRSGSFTPPQQPDRELFFQRADRIFADTISVLRALVAPGTPVLRCILLAANDILLLESIPRSIRSSSLHSTRLDCARGRALSRSPLPSGAVSSGPGREPPHQLQVLQGCTSTFRVPLGVHCAGALRPPISSGFRCCGPA